MQCNPCRKKYARSPDMGGNGTRVCSVGCFGKRYVHRSRLRVFRFADGVPGEMTPVHDGGRHSCRPRLVQTPSMPGLSVSTVAGKAVAGKARSALCSILQPCPAPRERRKRAKLASNNGGALLLHIPGCRFAELRMLRVNPLLSRPGVGGPAPPPRTLAV